MSKPDLNKAKQFAKELYVLEENIEDLEWNDIVNALTCADDLYHNGQESFLTDNQYDTLKQYAFNTNNSDPYFIGVGSEVRGGKVKLPYSMGSLVQSYGGDVEKWVEKYKLYTEKITISDKLDGVSGLVLYNNKTFQIGYSRGDGLEGADISRHLRKLSSVPKTINTSRIIAVRGEIIISEDNFDKLCEHSKLVGGRVYKNARNAISGLMNSSTNPDWVYQYIDFVVYEIVDPTYISKDEQLELLTSNNFSVVNAKVYDGGRLNDTALIDILTGRRAKTKYAIDGIVLEVNDADLRRKINPSKETLNPEFARKYKIASVENYAEAEVINVEFNVSKTGYLKPTIIIKPVELVGVTISRCTGFNAGFIRNNRVSPGARIALIRSGDVIPFCTSVLQPGNDFETWFSDTLSSFGEYMWTETGVDAYLIEDHPDIALERAKDFFVTIDAPILREGNIVKLFEAGFNTPVKIIKMSKAEMVSILGENGNKAFNGLHDKLNNIPEYVLMAASGEFGRGVGVRKLKKLYEAAKGSTLMFWDKKFVCSVEGFEEKTANRILAGRVPWEHFCYDVLDCVTLKPYEEKQSVDGNLSGQIFVFTGFRDKVLQQKIEDVGGSVADSYSKKVTCVVAKDPSENSGKLQKAHKDGIKVIGINEAWEMVE
jgi:NAD-dependent DNA ligase